MEENIGAITLDQRLSSIEKSITELRDVVLETKLQSKDIDALEQEQKEIHKDIEKINRTLEAHEGRIHDVEMAPVKSKADKWQYIMDYVFKTAIVAVCALVATKLGIN